MTKVFGVDRRVIAPDQNNIEATFFTAKKIDPGATGEIQMSLNYKELEFFEIHFTLENQEHKSLKKLI